MNEIEFSNFYKYFLNHKNDIDEIIDTEVDNQVKTIIDNCNSQTIEMNKLEKELKCEKERLKGLEREINNRLENTKILQTKMHTDYNKFENELKQSFKTIMFEIIFDIDQESLKNKLEKVNIHILKAIYDNFDDIRNIIEKVIYNRV